MLNVFLHFDADLTFQEHESFTGEAVDTRISVPLLIEYGIRRMKSDPYLQAAMSRKIPVLARKTYVYLRTVEEKEILEKVNGKEAAEIILKTLTVPPDHYWKSLYLFYCLGVVDFEGEAAGPKPDEKSRLRASDAVRADVPHQVAEVMALRETLPAMTYYQILDLPSDAIRPGFESP